MPKAKPFVRSAKSAVTSSAVGVTKHKASGKRVLEQEMGQVKSSTPTTKIGGLLEIDPSLCSKSAELANIVRDDVGASNINCNTSSDGDPNTQNKEEPSLSPDFVDDPDVPPLI